MLRSTVNLECHDRFDSLKLSHVRISVVEKAKLSTLGSSDLLTTDKSQRYLSTETFSDVHSIELM